MLLCQQISVRQIVSSLQLRASTTYRWIHKYSQIPLPRDLDTVLERIEELVEHCEAAGFSIRSLVMELMPSLSRRFVNYGKRNGETNRSALKRTPESPSEKSSCLDGDGTRSAGDAIERAKSALDVRFRERWPMSRLAGFAGHTKYDFIRTFTNRYGISPHQYLIRVRVHHAELLLKKSSIPLPEVARKVGFGSASAMQRSFQNLKGASPATVVNNVATDEIGKPLRRLIVRHPKSVA